MLKKFLVCPECNVPVEEREFVVCPHCGKPIAQKENIKREIDKGAKYCTNCGKEIVSTLSEALADGEKGENNVGQ